MIHVALLRGINVGGHNKLAMATLRAIAEGCGFEDVRTYVQSGNVVFRSPQSRSSTAAARLREAIASETGLEVDVMARTRKELAAVAKANPFTGRTDDPTKLHVVFFGTPPRPSSLASLDLAAYAPEEARLVAGHLYLHLPDGIGRSRLAADLTRKGGGAGTVRNWRTVKNLLELAEGL